MANLGGQTLTITMRPKTFDEVVGLESQVSAIKNKIAEGVPRAFALFGPFGCGKTTLAYIIAKAVQGWDFAGSPQVQFINAAKVTGIDAMRELVDSAGCYPMVGKYNVIILDEAHKLSKPAQESLLAEFECENSPTVWVLCSTDPQKLITGLRAGRCFTQTVAPLTEENLRKLVARGQETLKHTGEVETFIRAALKAQIGSPRKVLMAFEAFHAGDNADTAVGSQTVADLPEYNDIAFAVVFGNWSKETTLQWMAGKTIRPVSLMLKELDDKLKKKSDPTEDTDEADGVIDEEDLMTKPEVATAIRGIVGAYLKGQMLPTIAKGKQPKYKDEGKVQKAYEAMHILANTVPATAPELIWSGTIAALFRINQKLQGK